MSVVSSCVSSNPRETKQSKKEEKRAKTPHVPELRDHPSRATSSTEPMLTLNDDSDEDSLSSTTQHEDTETTAGPPSESPTVDYGSDHGEPDADHKTFHEWPQVLEAGMFAVISRFDDGNSGCSSNAVMDHFAELEEHTMLTMPSDVGAAEGDIDRELAKWSDFSELAGDLTTTSRSGLGEGAVYVIRFYSTGCEEAVVERKLNVLTPQEAQQNLKAVTLAMFVELQKGLRAALIQLGMETLKADPQLHAMHADKAMVLVTSSHADDLKGAETAEDKAKIINLVEEASAKLKVQIDVFECVSVMHEQNPETGEILSHQYHYVRQPREIDVVTRFFMEDEMICTGDLQTLYMSLVDAIAWLTLITISVYIGYLQRKNKEPSFGHVKRANQLPRWIRRHKRELGLRFVRPKGPLKLMVVSDSAIKAQDPKGFGMRGYVVSLRTA